MSNTGKAAEFAVAKVECEHYRRIFADLFANKWSARVVGILDEGPTRFGKLQRELRGVSAKVLTRTLRRLEHLGLVDRVVYPDVPLRVEYSLTELGGGTAGLLRHMRSWVHRNIDEAARVSLSRGPS
ncbi:winged helix-turn-helix transcriptional regulator [Amycolatopsis sp. CA-126428]|uniref:winged helix-turn-helix transcriptional regulator n=1 Tax=Amycolatopsis sp. CA-126428 TaxID=2073158 RepID=UPI000CD0A99E|nr:helix-turn-helix domain-containing protein [Amycolatopsis sp. CA-126428]